MSNQQSSRPTASRLLTASREGPAEVRLRTLSGRKGFVSSSVFSLCG